MFFPLEIVVFPIKHGEFRYVSHYQQHLTQMTGESIVIAPSQTLTNSEYYRSLEKLRSWASGKGTGHSSKLKIGFLWCQSENT